MGLAHGTGPRIERKTGMLILAARVYHDCEDVTAPGAFVLKLTPEVLAALKSDVEYLKLCEGVERFASISFGTPGGIWVENEALEELIGAGEEVIVADWWGSIPEDNEPMDRQRHQLRLHSSLAFEISFHARGYNSGFNYSTEPITYAWLLNTIEEVEKSPEYILMELGY